jgi:DNA polymerase
MITGDFETYSEADLGAVGDWNYSLHPTTEILELTYRAPKELLTRIWVPGMEDPYRLFQYIRRGGLFEAHNSFFEFCIWNNVGAARLGWPILPLEQLRCSAAKGARWSLPRKLETACEAVKSPVRKDKPGHAVMLKLCKPKKASKAHPHKRYTPENAPGKFLKLYSYGITDTDAECMLSSMCPELSPSELKLWLLDQKINARGIYVDVEVLQSCERIIRQVFHRLNMRLSDITGGELQNAEKRQVLVNWLVAKGLQLPNAQKETLEKVVEDPNLDPVFKEVIQIRLTLASASVKKVFAMLRRAASDGRMRNLLTYCGAAHTQRWAGSGVQPHNFPKDGPDTVKCLQCGQYYWPKRGDCPACKSPEWIEAEWNQDCVELVLPALRTEDLSVIEATWGNPLKVISGCLRGMLRAAPGYELLGGDYAAIEARILAELAGEQWRQEVFRTHGKIYEMSASKISGVPFEEFLRYKESTGQHHPLRGKLGKVSELASGYQGALGAWIKFGADKFMTEEEILTNVKKWRVENPAIVSFWYGVEDAAKEAIQNPGTWTHYRDIWYIVTEDVLACKLPSGRFLYYHTPRLEWALKWDKYRLVISYWGVHSKSKKWVKLYTYGGHLTENIVQGTARDILAAALIRLEDGGYPVVFHVHDEVESEVLAGTGSTLEFRHIMEDSPSWAKDWPITAPGVWRGIRYRKD